MPAWASIATIGLGVAVIAAFVIHCRRAANPFVPIDLVIESRFLRSALAAFTQMFALGAVLLALPLYLTGSGSSTTQAG